MASFRKKGNVWQYRIRYKDPYSDNWKETSKSGFKTKKEAQLAASAKEQELLNGIEQGEMKFDHYLRNWLDTYIKDKLKPGTYRAYRLVVEKHAIPHFGVMDIKNIKPMMYQKFINEKLESGLSTGTTRKIHNVIFQAMKRAVINGYISKNPCENVSIKKTEVKRLEYLEPEYVSPLLKELYKRGQIYGLFFKVLFNTGMRKGEAASLQWSDIDWKNNLVTIKQTLDFQPDDDDPLFGGPKTYSSNRVIDIRPSIMAELQTHLKYQNERKLHLGDAYRHDLNLVLCRDDGSPLPKSTLYNAFKAGLEKIGHEALPIHSTRHTHVVIQLEAGSDMKYIQERLGHASMDITTNIYAHVSKKIAQRSGEKFNEYMKQIE